MKMNNARISLESRVLLISSLVIARATGKWKLEIGNWKLATDKATPNSE
jgi:hypothetical protein